MIYKKIKKAKENLLKMNALEAAQAGAKGTGIDLNEKEDESSSPITYKSSPAKQTDPFVSKGSATFNGDPGEYFERKRRELGGTKTIPGLKVEKLETDNEKYLKSFEAGFARDNEGFDNITDYRLNREGKYKAKEVKLPDVNFLDKKFVPDPPKEVKKPAEQNYNMSYAKSVNANQAEGAQRRGTRRAERRANRDIRKYEEGSKGFLGLGKGKGKGELSANVIAAGDKTGKTIKGLNYDTDGKVTGDADQKVTEQMTSRAKSLSMNKYGQGLNEFNYKPGSSSTEDPTVDPNAPVIDNLDTEVVTGNENKTVFSDFLKNKTFGGSLMTGFGSGINKKGYKPKNSSIAKKIKPGAGY